MEKLRLIVDTHDTRNGTLPENLTAEQFRAFFAEYQQACHEEGVVPVQIDLGLRDGRAFCMNLAPNADAVRRAHERVGLPFDTITEVEVASSTGLFMSTAAA